MSPREAWIVTLVSLVVGTASIWIFPVEAAKIRADPDHLRMTYVVQVLLVAGLVWLVGALGLKFWKNYKS